MKFLKVLFSLSVLILIQPSCALLNITPSKKIKQINFNYNDVKYSDCNFVFSDYQDNIYLDSLKKEFKYDSLITNISNDLEKALILLAWTNKQWEHSMSNEPEKSDAISILNEVKEGKSFRCVEYGIVLAEVLKSVGIPARTLGLKTKIVEKIKIAAGHVVTEAYIKDLNKWIFLDGQMNLIPALNGIPLNGVEFQKAIINNKDSLKFLRYNEEVSIERKESYIKWVGKYLFYFSSKFDNRNDRKTEIIICNNKSSIMLVPIGEIEPTVFQRKSRMDYFIYTKNYKDFYKKPLIKN
ncbi:MAG: transglutaminase domain-containing protein [Bacteroidales bacterium]|nr:transglutaminase domain-containing protein [Bacteroidales bacterium]MBN2756837.1 transglutaminase domain-containing protein [Bacteroidales bacterium]